MLNKSARFFAIAALVLCVIVFGLDLFTRHFFLLINDTLSIVVLSVVLWCLHKLKKV